MQGEDPLMGRDIDQNMQVPTEHFQNRTPRHDPDKGRRSLCRSGIAAAAVHRA